MRTRVDTWGMGLRGPAQITVAQATAAGWYRPNTTGGLCECGCGQSTPIAAKTFRRRGQIKGEPVRFLNGHYGRTAEQRARMAELGRSQRGEAHPCYGRKLTPEHIEAIRRSNLGRPISAESRTRMAAAKRGERNPNWRGGSARRAA